MRKAKKSNLNASRPDGWVWMRSLGTESRAVEREGSLEVKPTDHFRGPRSHQVKGPRKARSYSSPQSWRRGEGLKGRDAVYLAETMTASASSQRSWGNRWSVFLERRKSPGNTTPPATIGVSMLAQTWAGRLS